MITKLLIPTLLLGVLGGCASTKELSQAYKAQREVVQAQAKATKPLFELSCDTGCEGLNFKYTPHTDYVVPKVTNTNDVINSVVPYAASLTSTLGIAYAGMQVARDVTKNMGGRNTNVTNNTITNGNGNTNTNTQNPTKTVTDGVINDNQNHAVDNSSTATPTIVNQPSPIIVNPEVVNPVVVNGTTGQ